MSKSKFKRNRNRIYSLTQIKEEKKEDIRESPYQNKNFKEYPVEISSLELDLGSPDQDIGCENQKQIV